MPWCQIGGKPIRIYFPVLHPRPSIPAIYQINKSFRYHCYSEQRNTYLSERHADNDKVGTESKFSARYSNLPSAESRICFESEKIIPGIHSEHGNIGRVIDSVRMEILLLLEKLVKLVAQCNQIAESKDIMDLMGSAA